jgi:hypothetical protein
MRKNKLKYTREEEIVDVVSFIVSSVLPGHLLRSTKIELGHWPCTQFHPYDEKNLKEVRGTYTIYLPLIKNMSFEFFQKIKMFAAHEVAHILYTYSNVQLTEFQFKCKGDPFTKNVLNLFEDIRIEKHLEKQHHEILSQLLPLSFKEFRRLIFSQLGIGKTDVNKLLFRSQLSLIDVRLDLSTELESIFANHLLPIIAKYKGNFSSPEHTIGITIEVVNVLKQLFPEEVKEITEQMKAQEEAMKAQKVAGDGNPIEGEGTLVSTPYMEELEGTEVLLGEDFKDKLQKALAGGHCIPVKEDISRPSMNITYRNEILKTYRSSVQAFSKLFAGGWRAPRQVVRTEVEEGEIDPEFLYKGKLRGKDRGVYQSTKRSLAEGLRVLVLLDKSGSMTKAQMNKVLQTSVVIDQACSVKNNVKAKIMYFTDRCQVARDWDDKIGHFNRLEQLVHHQGGTPTAGALNLELPDLLKQDGDKFIVVVTDGHPDNTEEARKAFLKARSYGVKILYLEFSSSGGSNVKDCVDYYLKYNNDQLSRLPNLLYKDIMKVIKDHGKQVLRRQV